MKSTLRLLPPSVLLLVAFLLPPLLAQEPPPPPPPAEPAPPPPQVVAGNWKVTPLAQRGDYESGSTRFPEFGAGYWAESHELIFWARTGSEKDKGEWALFSLQNGQARQIARHDLEFTEPDGVKKKIRRGMGGYYPAGKLIYVNIPLGRLGIDSDVYTWDGERLKKVLDKEDPLTIGATTYVLDSAQVFGVRRDGMAMISYRTERPKKTSGCVLHDGAKLIVTKLPDPLPGVGVSPDVEGEVSYCPQFPEGSLMFMKVRGAAYKSGLFYLTPQKVELLVSSEDPDPFQERKKVEFRWAPHIWPTGPDTGLVLGPLWSGNQGLELTAWSWNQGKLKPLRVFLRESKGFNAYDMGYLYFPHPREPEALFTIMLQRVNSFSGRVDRILPDMYHFDGEQVRPIQWEQVLGKELSELKKGTGSLLDLMFYGLPRRIEMRAVPGQARGVILEMPVKKEDARRTWYLDTNARDFKLVPVPSFNTGTTYHFFLDDVIAWQQENEVVVETEDGFFLLTRQ